VHVDFASAVRNFEGSPLKNIELSIGGKRSKGELIITQYGIEGNALYPLIPAIRSALYERINPQLTIDFKPLNTVDQLIKRVQNYGHKLNYKKALNITDAQLALLKSVTSKATYLNPELFLEILKRCPLDVKSLRPIDEAISTAGGLSLDELNGDFSLRSNPSHYAIGEMLDWETHTGGYLLHACYAMARKVSASIRKKS